MALHASSGTFAGGGVTSAITGTGATVTASAPVLDMSQTWNNAGVTFTGWKLNVTSTASGASSLLADFQMGGASVVSIRKDGQISAANSFVVGASASTSMQSNTVALGSASTVTWASTSNSFGTVDTGLSRTAAAVLAAGNGTNGDATGQLVAKTVRTPALTVSGLPAAATAGAGARAFVTDATVTTFASTVAGGGANKVPVTSDGTNWIIG